MPEQVQHTLYQVSTATALVEGIYQGAVQIATLRTHGDLRLGTFESLDGEMVIVDGHFFQVRLSGPRPPQPGRPRPNGFTGRAELPAPFTSQPKRASGKALTFEVEIAKAAIGL